MKKGAEARKHQMVRLPLDLYNQLANGSKESGITVQKMLYEAVSHYLECDLPPILEFIRQRQAQRKKQ